jgi:hypothetical protein
MRVFLIQTALGLFASSGGYKTNLTLLKHLASRGHATAQFCFAYEGEVEAFVSETEYAHLTVSEFQFQVEEGVISTIKVRTFTNIHGIHVIALDAAKFGETFPERMLMRETTDFIEVG